MIKKILIKKEWIIIFLTLIMALGAILVLSMAGGKQVAVVTLNGQEYGRYSLKEDRVITIENGDNSNILEIKEGSIWMKKANCPDKLCEKMAHLSEDKQGVIVCLPHELIVSVE